MIYIISLVLAVLKLAGTISWPWVIVLSPLWLYWVPYLVLKAIGMKS